MNVIIQNQQKADPLEFKELILIPKVDGFYSNLSNSKVSNIPHLPNIMIKDKVNIKWKMGSTFCCIKLTNFPRSIIIKIVSKSELRTNGTEKIQFLSQLIFQTSDLEQLFANCLFLSNNFMLVTIKSDSRLKINIYSTSSFTQSQQNYQFSRHLNFEYQISTVQDLEKTIHVSVTHNKKTVKVKLEKDDHTTYGKGNTQLMKILLKEAKRNKKEIYQSTILIQFYLKDKFENSFSDIKNQIYSQSNCDIKQVSGNQSILNLTFYNLIKEGNLNANLTFDPIDLLVLNDTAAVEFFINNQLKTSQISGIGLNKRIQRFQETINQVQKPKSYNLNRSRVNSWKIYQNWLRRSSSINLAQNFRMKQREFYDMIGNTLKDENFKFFSPVSSDQNKYYLHQKFNKQKIKERNALLFGKLIANSICNSYLIGIDIIAPFWKVVFNERILFNDLTLIWDLDTYNNYEKFKIMNEEKVKSVCLCSHILQATLKKELIAKDLKQMLLKKIQSCILIRLQSMGSINSLTKSINLLLKDFNLFQRSQYHIVNIIQICQKWLMTKEMLFFTQRLLEISSDILLQKFTFSGGKPQHKSYLENYVNQADTETMKNMLKFITGSSSILFDQCSSVISVNLIQDSLIESCHLVTLGSSPQKCLFTKTLLNSNRILTLHLLLDVKDTDLVEIIYILIMNYINKLSSPSRSNTSIHCIFIYSLLHKDLNPLQLYSFSISAIQACINIVNSSLLIINHYQFHQARSNMLKPVCQTHLINITKNSNEHHHINS